MRPEWALRTDRSFRVVHALFMWTTNDAVGRDNRFSPVYLYELENRTGDGEIRAHISWSSVNQRLRAAGLAPASLTIATD